MDWWIFKYLRHISLNTQKYPPRIITHSKQIFIILQIIFFVLLFPIILNLFSFKYNNPVYFDILTHFAINLHFLK